MSLRDSRCLFILAKFYAVLVYKCLHRRVGRVQHLKIQPLPPGFLPHLQKWVARRRNVADHWFCQLYGFKRHSNYSESVFFVQINTNNEGHSVMSKLLFSQLRLIWKINKITWLIVKLKYFHLLHVLCLRDAH